MEQVDNLSYSEIQSLPNEEWRAVVGYEGLYEVSNIGRVKGLNRRIIKKRGYVDVNESLIKIQLIDNVKYVSIISNKIKTKHKNRQLKLAYVVSKAFIENKNNYKFILHKDNDSSNCNSDNLDWCSINDCNSKYTKNIRDLAVSDYLNGKTLKELQGIYLASDTVIRNWILKAGFTLRSKNYHIIISEDIKNSILIDFKDGLNYKEIALKYKCSNRFVTDYLSEKGLDFRILKQKDSIERKEKALHLYVNEELNCADISKIIGVSSRSIWDWVYKAGVVKTMSEINCIMAQKGKKHNHGIKSIVETKYGNLRCDSSYEAARAFQLNEDISVINFGRCEFKIPYTDSLGKKHHYNPDFKIELKDGTVIIEEVKPEAMLNQRLNPIRHKAGLEFCESNGYIFRIVTEKDIFKKQKK